MNVVGSVFYKYLNPKKLSINRVGINEMKHLTKFLLRENAKNRMEINVSFNLPQTSVKKLLHHHSTESNRSISYSSKTLEADY